MNSFSERDLREVELVIFLAMKLNQDQCRRLVPR